MSFRLRNSDRGGTFWVVMWGNCGCCNVHVIMGGMTMGRNCHSNHAHYNAREGEMTKRGAIIMCAVKHIIMGGMTMCRNCHRKHASYNAGGEQHKRWGDYNVCESTL